MMNAEYRMDKETDIGNINGAGMQDLDFWKTAVNLSGGLRDIEQAVNNSTEFKKMYDLARFVPVHLSRLIKSKEQEERVLHLENTKHYCVLLLCKINGLVNLRSTCLMKKTELNNRIYSLIKDATVYCNDLKSGFENDENRNKEFVREAVNG